MSGFEIKEEKVHEHGFVRLVEVMGSDNSIEDAARVSYGSGTRKTSETRGLLRYLMRHHHTTPFEMAVVRFHIKLPIFVMRQHIRHRTASVNEYSGRYSEMSNEFYVPDFDHIAPQSTTNKQGRSGKMEDHVKHGVQQLMTRNNREVFEQYKHLLDEKTYGLSRELARTILPVSNYTECYWQINLHNFFHYLKLRTDSHAQQEIQDFANAMYRLAKPHFPLSFEAWEDYSRDSKVLSKMEQTLLIELIKPVSEIYVEAGLLDRDEMFKRHGERLNMSKREWDDFFNWYDALNWYEAKEY